MKFLFHEHTDIHVFVLVVFACVFVYVFVSVFGLDLAYVFGYVCVFGFIPVDVACRSGFTGTAAGGDLDPCPCAGWGYSIEDGVFHPREATVCNRSAIYCEGDAGVM